MTKLLHYNKQSNLFKVFAMMLVFSLIMSIACPVLFAAPNNGNTAADTDVNSEAVMKNLLKWVFTIFRYIGILLCAWAIGQLVLAFKNEDADSKSRAMMLLVASIILMSVKSIFKALGIAGFTDF